MAWLLKDYHGNDIEVEVAEIHDWVCIRLMCLMVEKLLLKDCYENVIDVTDMNYWLGMRLLCM